MDNIPSSTTGPTGQKPPLLPFIIGGLIVLAGAVLLPSASLIGVGVALIVVGIAVVIIAVRRLPREPASRSGKDESA